jgi:cell wall-associated NlpC family hydrolase
MKKTKLLNVTILSSIIFFTACSNKQDEIKKEAAVKNISVYNIMGITEPTTNFSFPTERNSQVYVSAPTPSHDIEYISYRQNNVVPQPVLQAAPVETIIPQVQLSRPISIVPDTYQTVNNIEWNAKSFLGIPYVWGATGPSKFDCSGFTQWVYRDAGINIPRVSKDQARVGQYVAYNNLQRGDMVFFDTKKRPRGIVTHVGIYLGQGNFIHASSAGKKVVIYNFNDKPFYKKRFLWGRRVTQPSFRYAMN